MHLPQNNSWSIRHIFCGGGVVYQAPLQRRLPRTILNHDSMCSGFPKFNSKIARAQGFQIGTAWQHVLRVTKFDRQIARDRGFQIFTAWQHMLMVPKFDRQIARARGFQIFTAR